MTDYAKGDRVWHNNAPGTVFRRTPPPRTNPDRDIYVVDWDNGTRTTVWGSDLLPDDPCAADGGCRCPAGDADCAREA